MASVPDANWHNRGVGRGCEKMPGLGELAGCATVRDRPAGETTEFRRESTGHSSSYGHPNGHAAMAEDTSQSPAVVYRIQRLEDSFNQQMVSQRNLTLKQQKCVEECSEALTRLEEKMQAGAHDQHSGRLTARGSLSGRLAAIQSRSSEEAESKIMESKILDAINGVMATLAELKASAHGRESQNEAPLIPFSNDPSRQDSSVLEAVHSVQDLVVKMGTKCDAIDVAVHSVQDWNAKMSQHIQIVELAVTRQTGAISTSTETLSQNLLSLKKLEEKTLQDQAASAELIRQISKDQGAVVAALASPKDRGGPGGPQIQRESVTQPSFVERAVEPEPVNHELQPLTARGERDAESRPFAGVYSAAPHGDAEPPSRPDSPVSMRRTPSDSPQPDSPMKNFPQRHVTPMIAPVVKNDEEEVYSNDIFSRIATSASFSFMASLMIMLNMLFIGIDVSLKVQWNLDLLRGVETPVTKEWPLWQQNIMFYLEWLFAIWMSFEFVINMVHCFHNKWIALRWNLFDVILLTTTWLDVAQATVNLSFLRLGKIYRLVKVMRVGKVFRAIRAIKFLHGVRKMLLSVAGSLTSLFWSFLLMTIIMYVVSMVMLQSLEGLLSDEVAAGREVYLAGGRLLTESPGRAVLAGSSVATRKLQGSLLDSPPISAFYLTDEDSQLDALYKWYGGLGTTMMTLFRTISGGAEWAEVADPLNSLPGGTAFTFIWLLYVGFMIFGVLNVLTGVFCDAAMKAANEDKDLVVQEMLAEKDYIVETFKKIFAHSDRDGSGYLDRKEFAEMVSNQKVKDTLMQLGIDSVEAAGDIFTLIDDDESGYVGVEEFVTGCMRMKGGARGVDVVTMIYEMAKVKARMERSTKILAEIFDEVRLMQGKIAAPRDDSGLPILR